jgi:transcription elongation factor GreA
MAIKLTRAGLKKMQKELKYLKEDRRPIIIDAIATAREKGDLKENAEYDAAKEAQGHLEGRIAKLETVISDVDILDDKGIDSSKAFLGATVGLKDKKRKREIKYMLVSKEEADFEEAKISIESPVGKALLGKSVGDNVEVTIPAGTLEYEIIAISR